MTEQMTDNKAMTAKTRGFKMFYELVKKARAYEKATDKRVNSIVDMKKEFEADLSLYTAQKIRECVPDERDDHYYPCQAFKKFADGRIHRSRASCACGLHYWNACRSAILAKADEVANKPQKGGR